MDGQQEHSLDSSLHRARVHGVRVFHHLSGFAELLDRHVQPVCCERRCCEHVPSKRLRIRLYHGRDADVSQHGHPMGVESAWILCRSSYPNPVFV